MCNIFYTYLPLLKRLQP